MKKATFLTLLMSQKHSFHNHESLRVSYCFHVRCVHVEELKWCLFWSVLQYFTVDNAVSKRPVQHDKAYTILSTIKAVKLISTTQAAFSRGEDNFHGRVQSCACFISIFFILKYQKPKLFLFLYRPHGLVQLQSVFWVRIKRSAPASAPATPSTTT